MRTLLIGSGLLLTVWLALVAVAWALQSRMIFFPDARLPQVGEGIADEVTLTTRDGVELGGWFVRASDAAPGEPRAALLVANGNAGNRASRLGLATRVAQRGHHVLLFDYRGYGGNEGEPAVATLVDDVRAAADHLRHRDDVTGIVFFGESIGSLGAAALAAEDPPDGMVLRSPPSSLADVGAMAYPFLPVRMLLRDDVDVADAFAAYEGPLLVVIGTADRIVPPELSRRVADRAPNARVMLIEGAGHNDAAMIHGLDLIDAVDRMIAASVDTR